MPCPCCRQCRPGKSIPIWHPSCPLRPSWRSSASGRLFSSSSVSRPRMQCHAVRQDTQSLHQARRRRTPSPRHFPTRRGPAWRQMGASRHRAQFRTPLRPVRKGLACDLPTRRRSFGGLRAMGSESSQAIGATCTALQVNCGDARASLPLRRRRNATFRKSTLTSLAVLTSAQQHDLKGKKSG